MTDDLQLLRASLETLLASVDALNDQAFAARSRLPGWTRAHLITHLARATDSRTGLLSAARSGAVGRQYASQDRRANAIEIGAARPAHIIRTDLCTALDRFMVAVHEHPDDLWDSPGDWLQIGRAPVRRAVPSMRREAEYHHVDLNAGYRPQDWPEDFVRAQLPEVVESLAGRPGTPPITIVLPDHPCRWATAHCFPSPAIRQIFLPG